MKSKQLKMLVLFLVFTLLLTACASSDPGTAAGSTASEQTTQPDTTDDTTETTAPIQEISVFPEAPESASIQALPAAYDVSLLVSPYWEQATQFSNVHTYYVAIPQIYPFSEDAVACQQEIYDLYETNLSSTLETWAAKFEGKISCLDMPEDAFYDRSLSWCYTYSAGCYNDVLSIIVRFDLVETNLSNYHVFYLDLTTGKRLDAAQASAKYGTDKADIKKAVESYFNDMHANNNMSLDYIQENLKKTVSDENIDACRQFCKEDGSLMFAANIYTAGSLPMVEKLIVLE